MENPFLFSVVIPTYNRPEQLHNCLSSLTRLEYDRTQFEVIVVDDGSEQALNETINSFQSTLNLKLVRQKNAGPASARNRGAQVSTGRFLAFTDDDCCPEKDWLQKLEVAFAESPTVVVGGQTINSLTQNIFSIASQHIIDIGYEHCNSNFQQARFFSSNNMAVPRKLFLQFSGFDERFRTSEDREFCDRWLKSGLVMTYKPDIIIRHSHSMNFFGFWRQHFEYGRGTCLFYQICSQKEPGKFKIEVDYYFKLVLSAFEYEPLLKGTSIAIAILISQFAYTLGFLQEKLQNFLRRSSVQFLNIAN